MRLPEGVKVHREKFFSFARTNKKVGVIDFWIDGETVTKIGICYGINKEQDINFIYRNGKNFNEEDKQC